MNELPTRRSEVALYIVLHHPKDRDQPWVNRWSTDGTLCAITTTADIAARCHASLGRGERVFVHRRGHRGGEPAICCSVAVKKTGREEDVAWVDFHEPEALDLAPTFFPKPGEGYYFAPPWNGSLP